MKYVYLVLLSSLSLLNGCFFDFNVAMPIGEVRISDQGARVQSMIWVLTKRPAVSQEQDCQEKMSDPESVYVDSLWLSITGNTLSYDLPAGNIYFATEELGRDFLTRLEVDQLVQDGTLVKLASVGGIYQGENSERLLHIDEGKNARFTKRFLTKATTLVIALEDSGLNAQMMVGGISLNLSANVIVTLAGSDLRCVRQFPES